MSDSTPVAGRVCLVGAGPGDPGLITVAGREALRRAEVLIYDALANPTLLNEAPADALRIDAGKRAKAHRLTQDQTNALLVEHAQAGRFVVRLKGGDPYLFGRGAEEVAYCAQHGVACEVIPGITAGIAAPMAAGIPVTHRDHASVVAFVTGHEDPTKSQTALDYQALSRLIQAGGTACFYMGVGRSQPIADALMQHGLSAATPAAAVQWGTLPRQRQARATLATLTERIKAADLAPPAIIVVGPVAGIDEPGLDYFTRRPLFGQRIVITRTRHQASTLAEQLASLGADVLQAPTIELAPPPSWDDVDQTLQQLDQFDWLILTSTNGVEVLAERLATLGRDSRALAGVRIAAVGDATAEALFNLLHIRADLVPTRFVAESLAAQLVAQEDMQAKRVLMLRADIARPALPERLTAAGATVVDCVAYQTQLASELPQDVLDALRDGSVNWVTFTSASTARNMVELLGDESTLLESLKLASIGPITTAALAELGLTPAVEASENNVDGLVQAILEHASLR